MKPAVYMVVKDEEFYIGMALMSVPEDVPIFIIDTGSKDSTVSVIQAFQTARPGMIHLEIDLARRFGASDDRWSPEYQDMEVHNYAMDRAKVLFNPDWLVLLDGDEVYLPRFWEVLQDADRSGEQSFGYPEVVPVTPTTVCNQDKFFQTWTKYDGHVVREYRMFDPHIKSWRADSGIRWTRRSPVENLHIVPSVKEIGYVSEEHLHVHLHHSFGPKSIYNYLSGHNTDRAYWDAQQASETLGISKWRIYDEEYYRNGFRGIRPLFHSDGRFLPTFQLIGWTMETIPIQHPLPDYVVEKWKGWMVI